MKKGKLPPNKARKNDIPKGLWSRCEECGETNFKKALDENLKVCPHCQRHSYMGARERIHSLMDTCAFEEHDPDMTAVDALKFVDITPYPDRLAKHQERT